MLRRLAFVPPLFVAAFAFVPAAAHADDLPCGPVTPGEIRIDGLLDDWDGVNGLDVGDGGDFSFRARCNFDKDALYLVIDVRDDHLVRSRPLAGRVTGQPALEDHVSLAFATAAAAEPVSAAPAPRANRRGRRARRGAAARSTVKGKRTLVNGIATLVIAPSDREHAPPIPRRVYWLPARPAAALGDVEVADALQPHGWAVELRMPLSRVPGWSPGAASIRLGVGAVDVDEAARPKIEATLATSALDDPRKLGVVELGQQRASVTAFLSDQGLYATDIRMELEAHLAPGQVSHVLLAGKLLAVVDETYSYLDLPVATPSDVLEVRVADLAGDGRDAILVRYRETVPGPSPQLVREVVGAWRFNHDGLQRVFAVEIARSRGPSRVDSRVSYVKHPPATDIVVERGKAVGWGETSYHESASDDVVPMLLPWDKRPRQRFQFQGDAYSRAE